MKKATFLLLFCCFAAIGKAQTITVDALQTGDLIFLDLDCGPLCHAIESVTPDYKGQSFTHVGLIFMKNQQPLVVEATGKEVQINSLSNVISRSDDPIYIGRFKVRWQPLINKAIQFAKAQLGVPYDGAFLMNNGKYYCSELIYDAFKHANHGNPIFKLFPMTYQAPGADTFFKAWENYFEARSQPIPQGKPGLNPGSIAVSGQLTLFRLKRQ